VKDVEKSPIKENKNNEKTEEFTRRQLNDPSKNIKDYDRAWEDDRL
jgi:hypothetical protein